MDLRPQATETTPPFWMDEPNPYGSAGDLSSGRLYRLMVGLATLMRLVWLITVLGIMIFAALHFPLLWLAFGFTAVPMLYVLIQGIRRRRNMPRPWLRPAEIQALAREKTGADVIGSAVHSAGHPLLQVNQPVVLALRAGELLIYDYASPRPIDTIGVEDISRIETVVFDDDGAPHTDVVDATAQTLQLSFDWRGRPYTCSFRRMYKIRAIGWYQALAKARST